MGDHRTTLPTAINLSIKSGRSKATAPLLKQDELKSHTNRITVLVLSERMAKIHVDHEVLKQLKGKVVIITGKY